MKYTSNVIKKRKYSNGKVDDEARELSFQNSLTTLTSHQSLLTNHNAPHSTVSLTFGAFFGTIVQRKFHIREDCRRQNGYHKVWL
jgi:hypothetical protein